MCLDVYDAISLTIHANGNKIGGRTAIQKLIYFHSVKISKLEIVPYMPHFYGPFNREVESALEEMSAFSYLDEKKIISDRYIKYNYTLTEQGIQYAESVKKMNNEFKTIKKTVDVCKEHCDLRPAPLSYAAKSYYVLNSRKKTRTNNAYTIRDMQDAGKDFDWDISKEDMQTGIELLRKLELVSVH